MSHVTHGVSSSQQLVAKANRSLTRTQGPLPSGPCCIQMIIIKDLQKGPWDPSNQHAEQVGIDLLAEFLKFNLTSRPQGNHPEFDYSGAFGELPSVTIEQKVTSYFSPYLETRGLGGTSKGLSITEADYHLYIMPGGQGNIGKVRLYHTKHLMKHALRTADLEESNSQKGTQGAIGVRFNPMQDMHDKDFWVCDIATVQDHGRVIGFDEERVTKGFSYGQFLVWRTAR